MKYTSFVNYLKRTVAKLTEEETMNLKKIEEYSYNNVRLRTLFSIYAMYSYDTFQYLDKKKDLFPTLYNETIYCIQKYQAFKPQVSIDYMNKLNSFDELKKIYSLYLNSVVKKESTIKENYYSKILELVDGKQITKYRIYTDLNLNPGNVNDFFKNKALRKLSLQNVKKIHSYCYQYSNNNTAG